MGDLLRNIRYGFRVLLKSPGLSSVVLLTLAVGIGATTAMFSVVNGVLLRPLPFRDPDRLVLIKERLPKLVDHPVPIPASDIVTFRHESTSFIGVAGFIGQDFDLTGNGIPQRISGTRVEWNLFSALGVEPFMGRGFTAAEDHPGVYSAIVSYRFWRQRLGRSKNAIDQTVNLDRKPYQIIGVMPEAFAFPLNAEKASDVWVPMGFAPEELKIGATSFAYGALARLKPGVSPQQAQADVERITRHIAEMFPAAKRGDLQILGVVAPLKQDVIGDYRKPLLVLFLAVCFVLLIAVVNVANLLLARGTGRQRQFAIQIALGAGARRVIGQSLIESVILGVIGGVLGLALAFGLTRSLVAMVPSNVPRLQTTSIDGEVLLFVLTVSVLAGIAFGAAPAFFALRTRVNENLKQGGRGTSGGVTTSDCAPVS